MKYVVVTTDRAGNKWRQLAASSQEAEALEAEAFRRGGYAYIEKPLQAEAEKMKNRPRRACVRLDRR